MKKALIIIAAVVVLLIVVVIAAPFFIPVGPIKSQLIAAVNAATGRQLQINGPVSFSLIPELAVEANDVSFSNPPGASTKEMATLAQLQLRLKLLPLLHREVAVDSLVLVKPVIGLEVDKQGRPNWQFAAGTPQATAPPQPAGAPAAAGGFVLSRLQLDDVRLTDGRISYLDQRSGEKKELTGIAMKLSLPSLDSPLAADGSAVYRNETMTLALSLAQPRAFLEGKSSAGAIKLAGKPVSFDFKGQVTGSPLKLDGTVNLTVPSLRGLADWAGTSLQLPGSGYGPLAISGKVKRAGDEVEFTDASLSLDAIKAKGELALDHGGARPSLKGRLDVDRLDLNPYLPPEKLAKPTAGGQGGPGAPAASSDWSDDPLDLSPLKSADIDFTLGAGSLQYRKIQLGKSALTLRLKGGRLEAVLTQLALYQGAGKGKVVLDGSAAVPAIETDFNLDKVQIGQLLGDAADLNFLSGVGAFDMAVNGRGRSQREIIAALNGKGDLSLANGTIKGVDLVGMVNNIVNKVASTLEQAVSGKETDFGSLSATYTITNGVLHNKDLQLQSAGMPMTGAGTVDLLHRTVDYRITPRLVGVVAVPVLITGPWNNLSYGPDLLGIATDPATLLKGGGKDLGKAIQSAPGGVESIIKDLFGGQKQ